MGKAGSNFGKRNEDKAAKVQPRVGDLEFSSGDGLRAVEKNVQINEPGAFGELFFATHLGFNGVQRVQKGERLKSGFRFDDAI